MAVVPLRGVPKLAPLPLHHRASPVPFDLLLSQLKPQPDAQITQVAKNSKSDTGIAQLLSSLNIPYPTTAVHIGRKVGVLPELIEAHNAAVRALEGVLTRYFKDPDQLPTNRPSMRIGATMGCGGQKVVSLRPPLGNGGKLLTV